MKTTFTPVLLVCAALTLNACLPVAVGGGIYSHVKKKQSCKELLLDPAFTEKMQVEEFREFYEKTCTKEGKQAERCRGLADTSARVQCLDRIERKQARSELNRCRRVTDATERAQCLEKLEKQAP